MAVKKSNGAYQELRKALKEGEFGRLYVFHGEERYLLEDSLKTLRKKLVPEGMEEFNLHLLEGKGLDLNRLAEAVDSVPMMSEHTLTIVTDFDLFGCKEADKERLLQVFSDLPDYGCLVFVYDTLPYKIGRGKYQEQVKKLGSIVEFVSPSRSDLLDWVRRRFAALDKKIDDSESEYLIFLCGSLMTGLLAEIGKIASYAKGDYITRADIDAVAEPVLEAQVFDITDAVGARQFDRAFTVLSELYGLNQEPIMILAILGKHLRQLYTARLVLESGQGTGALMDMWNMKTDWQAKKLMKNARNCSLEWCRKAIVLAGETDFAMKSSGRNSEELLCEMMLKLANG